MRKALVVLLAAVLLSACCTEGPPRESWVRTTGNRPPVLKHVVLLAFSEGTTPEQVQTIGEEFLALENQIDGIKDITGGADVSVENLQQGFTHCFIVTFSDEAARDAYVPHQAHQAFVAFMKPNLDKVLVVDFLAAQ